MPTKKTQPRKTRHRDDEEYKRFLETAKKVEASDDPKDFDRAFKRVVAKPSKAPQRRP
jgi:hypothetical protein